MKLYLVLLLLTVFPTIANAETDASIGYASDAHEGVELIVGLSKPIESFTLTLNFINFLIYQSGSDPRYRKETLSNGNTICRDTTNGQFAKKDNCDPGTAYEYAPSAQVNYQVNPSFVIGGGYRGGDKTGAFAVLQFKIDWRRYIAINFGPNYSSASFGVTF